MRSPSAAKSITARRLRPISRWISELRPLGRPRVTSRAERLAVARGSMAYSLVTQPRPLPWRNGGTRFSTLAATSTRVSPISINAEPSAYFIGPISMRTGRRSPAVRPLARRKSSREVIGRPL